MNPVSHPSIHSALSWTRNAHAKRNRLEMNKVNTTAQAFIGGRTKDWMSGGGSDAGISVRFPARTTSSVPGSRVNKQLNRASSIDSGSVGVVHQAGRPIPILATVGPGEASPPPTASNSPDLLNSELPPGTTRSIHNVGAVLPSPAPSDTQSVTDRRDPEDNNVTAAAARSTPLSSPRPVVSENQSQSAEATRIEVSSKASSENGQVARPDASSSRQEQTARPEMPRSVSDGQLAGTKRTSSSGDLDSQQAQKRLKHHALPLQPLPDNARPVSTSTQTPSPAMAEQTQWTPVPSRNYTQSNMSSPRLPQSLTSTGPSAGPTMAQSHIPVANPVSHGGNPSPPLTYAASWSTNANSSGTELTMVPPSHVGSPGFASLNSPIQTAHCPTVGQADLSQYQAALSAQTQLRTTNQAQPVQSVQLQPTLGGGPQLKLLLPNYDSYIQREGGPGCQKLNPAECFRFRILREAIVANDWFFAVLHQLYTLALVNERMLATYTKVTANLPGIALMSEILHDGVNPRQKYLTYLSTMPVPLPDALKQLSYYHKYVAHVAKFMADGYKVRKIAIPSKLGISV